ncbi:MAG TPA: hypothetical protein VGJ82_12060 [Thermoanaerobaculia bacterium]|jgi:hypothetical protein
MTKVKPESELQRLSDRRECIPLTLVGSSVLALVILIAMFLVNPDQAAARAIAEKYSVFWFLAWWVFCLLTSGVKIIFSPENDSQNSKPSQ